MGKPLHAIAWATACAMETWTYDDISSAAGLTYANTMKMVRSWSDQGLVAPVQVGDDRRIRFRVISMTPAETPPEAAADASSPEAAMWQVMRGLGVFSAKDVAAHVPPEIAVVTEAAAQRFFGPLERAGYLKVVRKAVPGTRLATYRLIRNTGRLPPMSRRTQIVWDPNTGSVVYVAPVKS